MTAFFVTATGTDIGKTFITAGLVRHLRSRGKPASAFKPVISGFDPVRAKESDTGILLSAMSRLVSENEVARVSPWRFAAPLSPDMAAEREGGAVDFDALVKFSLDAVAEAQGPLFIEGVGGVMTPINTRHTALDWAAALRLPLIVAAGSYLGTISHTLTALDVMRRQRLEIAALIVNESADSTVPLLDTARTIGRFIAPTPVLMLPRHADLRAFADLAQRLALID